MRMARAGVRASWESSSPSMRKAVCPSLDYYLSSPSYAFVVITNSALYHDRSTLSTASLSDHLLCSFSNLLPFSLTKPEGFVFKFFLKFTLWLTFEK